MSSEVEKWIATWLDSASERGYQHAFVTALLLEGYEVLLSTSHNSMELGKDVIARGPDRVLYAYQLKGNPAGRYSMGDWHAGFNQIQQLVNMPISPVLNRRAVLDHRPLIVTNGELAEDVQQAADLFNRLPAAQKGNRNPLLFFTRGQILPMLYKHSKGIWPADIQSEIAILRFLSATGKGEFDIAALSDLLRAMLRWDQQPSRRALGERIAGTCLVTTIAISRWIDSGNLYEAVRALTYLLTTLYCFIEKYGPATRLVRRLIASIRVFVFEKITELEDYVVQLKHPLVNKNILSEFAYYHSRKMMILGMIAANLLERSRSGLEIRSDLSAELFRKSVDYPFLDGEYVLPSALAFFWATERVSGRRDGDNLLMSTLHTILIANSSPDQECRIPSPYYGLVDVARYKYRQWLGFSFHAIDRDSFRGSSWFAKSVFYVIARRNWKRHCRILWPQLTRMSHKSVTLGDTSEFASWRTDSATESVEIIEIPQDWDRIIAHAKRDLNPVLPQLLRDDPVTCLLFCMTLPFRMNEEIVCWLDRTFSDAWF